MFVDSHCHLDRVNLQRHNEDFATFVSDTLEQNISHMLCVSIDLEAYPDMLALVEPYPEISTSVGVHPDDKDRTEPTVERLVELSQHPKNVAIGETGLDYFREEGDLEWQRDRFRIHIRAAIEVNKPLIVHTREAREDTIRILKEEHAEKVGGVLHCFTESWEMAEQAIALNFYISFSGIVTFKNAQELREVALKVPLERMLIETDSPYLAPVPFRGKPNEPEYVKNVAEFIAELRDIEVEELARITKENYYRLFSHSHQS